MSELNPHAKHRERLKKRMLTQGLASFEPHVVLELFLSYCIPRKDTNELAHALIRRFGDLRGVFNAGYEDLLTVKGIGEHSASMIAMMPQLFRLYAESDPLIPHQIVTTEEASRFVVPRFMDARQEKLLLVYLGNKNQVLGAEFVSEGSLASVAINTRQIVERVIAYRATGLLLAHNHPEGFALPSPDDISATRKLKAVLEPMQVTLLDHIIVADNDHTSMRESGII